MLSNKEIVARVVRELVYLQSDVAHYSSRSNLGERIIRLLEKCAEDIQGEVDASL